MARLIDADAMIAEFKKQYCTDCENYGGVKCRACWVDDAMCMIEDAPTLDAIPVSKLIDLRDYLYEHDSIFMDGLGRLNAMIGRYKKTQEGMAHWIDDADCYLCSRCGYESNNPNKERFGAYRCPHCLAEMN